jgi:non-ribosomal peptide synthetase component F
MFDEPRLRSLFRAASAPARRRHLTTLLRNFTSITPGRRVALLLSAVPLEKLTNAQRDLIGHHLLSLLQHHGAGPGVIVAVCVVLTSARRATPIPVSHDREPRTTGPSPTGGVLSRDQE